MIFASNRMKSFSKKRIWKQSVWKYTVSPANTHEIDYIW